MTGGGLRVLKAGPGCTVQDSGRLGFLRYGVTPAGPMDWVSHSSANIVLGNEMGAAAVEVSIGGLDLVCEKAPLAVAVCGGGIDARRGTGRLPPAVRIILRPGQTLSLRPGASGAWCYLAVAGGIATEPVMGSRATHTRSKLGGLDGRMLREGDFLPAFAMATMQELAEVVFEPPKIFAVKPMRIRVIPGPQEDYFSPEARQLFYASIYTIAPEADRMAYRLHGPEIPHAKGYNIVSDGIALGAIQIAGDRQPLVLMADRQPTGGYPKIGHAARADMRLLAQMRPGETINFVETTAEAARRALLALHDAIARIPSHLTPLRGDITAERLLRRNLISGVINPYSEG